MARGSFAVAGYQRLKGAKVILSGRIGDEVEATCVAVKLFRRRANDRMRSQSIVWADIRKPADRLGK